MKRVLVTGMSGTGKSTLLAELIARGHPCVDTDYDGYTVDAGGERLWDEDRVAALLDSEILSAAALFVQGTVRNQVGFYARFDHIVLLSAPAEVIVERLRTRTTNPYGRRAEELAETLANLREVEPLLRSACTLEVVTTVPVTDVADAVLDHVVTRRVG